MGIMRREVRSDSTLSKLATSETFEFYDDNYFQNTVKLFGCSPSILSALSELFGCGNL